MSIDMEGRVAYLSGDWTITSLTKWKIDLLADVLQQIEAQGDWKLQVDCRNMTSTDRSGLELLHAWLQCARLRGFEPELINLPDTLKRPLQSLMLRTWNKDNGINLPEQSPAASHQTRRSLHNENRRDQGNRKAA